jgi:hypothetical protein
VLFIEVVIYKDISIKKDLPRVVVESMTLIGAILTIMACAVGFTGWLIQAEVPQRLLEAMQSMISSQFIFLLVLNVFLVIVGMLMEIFAAIVVAVPLVLPLARAYGLDPYHFAIIFLLNLEIAYLMPPLGINLFISSIRFGKPVTELYSSVLSFIAVLFVTLMFVSYVPIITTWLPSKVGDNSAPMMQGPDTPGANDNLDDKDFGLTGEDLTNMQTDGGVDAAVAGDTAGAADAAVAQDQPAAEEEPAAKGGKAKKAKAEKKKKAKAEKRKKAKKDSPTSLE